MQISITRKYLYHESVAKRKREAREEATKIKLERYDLMKVEILDMLSNEPWIQHFAESLYMNDILTSLRNAPTKGIQKALDAIVNDICSTFGKLFEFVTMDFLFVTNGMRISNQA